ncbi:murein hydrolase activator EnvC [Methylovirgula sp. HY1]|uniref:murein hydrolase activator EnvC family protein n=1 Tax=Methylovirgula sp. HY1 TaxID=2822761 RepID=UPI001C5BE7AE|nr:peptidoglycan DD-metalloendopeptidase family protein [Methylovirgula sp. HY1]QXX74955.1 Murein hydrolase activator EnvC [Methylovirgula sp. HY1]
MRLGLPLFGLFACLLIGASSPLLVAAAAAPAKTPKAEPPNPGIQSPASKPPAKAATNPDIDTRQIELRGLEDTLDQSDAQRRKIEAEIESLRNDRARLNAALIATTERVSAAEAKVSAAEKRLVTLKGSEAATRRSLDSRKALIGEVLASLQRMGHSPPPALLVSPEDMLQAVHSSMLLGAVLPEMHAETEALASDLSDLIRLRRLIATERDSLRREVADLVSERERLAALIDARQASLGTAVQALSAEQTRARSIAEKAANLKQLIAKMESEVAAAARAAEEARKADEARKFAEAETGGQTKANLSPFKDTARLAPAIAFADAKGLLSMPVAGTAIKDYGAPDGFGGTEKGLYIATRPGAVVALPSDGWIAFCGPYRSYGELLIVNVGGGYYVVLAGMERINVEVGQFVLAGEPVATMGDGSAKTAAAIAIGAKQPILYVEFRKDGAAIDPGPWWVKSDVQKVRG